MRRNIEWKIKREDRSYCEVRVSFFGGKCKFQFRESAEEQWDYKRAPIREELEMLHDAVKRRYQRRQATQQEVDEVERLLRDGSTRRQE